MNWEAGGGWAGLSKGLPLLGLSTLGLLHARRDSAGVYVSGLYASSAIRQMVNVVLKQNSSI